MIAEYLSILGEQGITVTAQSGKLQVTGPEEAISKEATSIISRKNELLASLCGLTLVEIQEEAGGDWPELKEDARALHYFAKAIEARRTRERAETPPTYTAARECEGCGPVWLEPWTPEKVAGCAWCLNRAKGMPVPKAGGNV